MGAFQDVFPHPKGSRHPGVAGIAHEIQNPLNFVNNFSEVSNELIEEMKEELASGDVHEAMEIAGDVITSYSIHYTKLYEATTASVLLHALISSCAWLSPN